SATFLVYLPARLPASPSFPTRRSSDLGCVQEPERLTITRAVPGNFRGPPLRIIAGNRSVSLATMPEAAVHANGHPMSRKHEIGLDRKSTRLNSSHGSISYAVFCLKKKK